MTACSFCEKTSESLVAGRNALICKDCIKLVLAFSLANELLEGSPQYADFQTCSFCLNADDTDTALFTRGNKHICYQCVFGILKFFLEKRDDLNKKRVGELRKFTEPPKSVRKHYFPWTD